MKIYFIRHGVTDGNVGNQFQVHTTPLSEKGVIQANFIAERLKNENIPIDIVFTSSMTRASQTAKIIGEKIGHNVIEEDLFEEIKRPSLVRGKSKDDPEVKSIIKDIQNHFNDPNWRHSDEENFFLARDRAKKALDFILNRKEQNILIVTHGDILKMMLALAVHGENLTPEIFENIKMVFAIFNTAISKFEFNDMGWYIRAWNDHAHLGEIE